MSAPPNPEAIMQLGMGFWASKTFLSAIELEVFTELAKHPEDIDALRVRLGLNERGARDFVDTLVALGMLEREDGVYRNTPNADFFLDKEKPSYIGGGQPPPLRFLGRAHRSPSYGSSAERNATWPGPAL